MLRGAANYTAAHAAGAYAARFVRSDFAHAEIVSIDLSATRALPGVIAAYSMADLAAVLPATPTPLDSITNRDGSIAPAPPRPALAQGRVRFAGEAVALVIAVSETAAADGVEAAAIEYNPLAAAQDVAGGEDAFDWAGGDAEATERAFANAPHIVTARVKVPRILGLPLEPICAVASYDPATERWCLITPSQGAHAIRRELTTFYLGVSPERLRVITPDVGGGFGIRIHALPEQAALLGAARLLGQRIAWRATRSESNLVEPHARDMLVDAELALDANGAFLGLRATAQCSLGAYVHPGARSTPTASLLFGLQGAYRLPCISLRVHGRHTNTTPTGPFRGAGQPEGTYVIERLIDRAARHLGIDPAEMRRRNVLCSTDYPYRSATSHSVDSGDAAGALHRASTWLSSRPRYSVLRHGTGLALYMKVNGMGRQERAEIVAVADSDRIVARIGSQSNGQGHATTFAALAASRLGLPADRITVVQGDTDAVAFGTGTGASSALATTGAGVSRSCADLLRLARAAAARHLDAPDDALEYAAGSFHRPGTNRFVTLRQLAAEAGGELTGRSDVPVTLTYTMGCHACHVGVDLETGVVQLLGYAAFDDLGPLLQPAIAHGQIHGGVAQGIGQALLEAMSYDDTAQPLTASLMDYAVPHASDLPALFCEPLQTPGLAGDLQIRGAGEAGAIASMAAVVNAIADAIGGDTELDAPLTSQRVWRALQASGPDKHSVHPLTEGTAHGS